MVSLLFILQSPNVGFGNFAVSIVSPVGAMKQKQLLIYYKNWSLSQVIVMQTTKLHVACACNRGECVQKWSQAL